MFHTNGLWLFCPREHPKRSNKRMTGFSNTNKLFGPFWLLKLFWPTVGHEIWKWFWIPWSFKVWGFCYLQRGFLPSLWMIEPFGIRIIDFLIIFISKEESDLRYLLVFLESQAHILMFLFSLFQKHLIIFCCSKWRDGQIVFETAVAWNCGVFAENPFKSKWGRFEVGGAIFGPGLLDFKQTSMICSNIEIPQFLGWN